MNKSHLYILAGTLLLGCGAPEEDTSDLPTEKITTYYSPDHKIPSTARRVKEKLTQVYNSLAEIRQSPGDKIICTEDHPFEMPVDSNGKASVYLLSDIFLDNFNPEKPGQFGYGIPRNGTFDGGGSTAELKFINCIAGVTTDPFFHPFASYDHFDSLVDKVQQPGAKYAYPQGTEEAFEGIMKADYALSNFAVAMVIITKYIPPTVEGGTDLTSGLIQGYFGMVDYETGEISCLYPIAANSSGEISYNYTEGTFDGINDQQSRAEMSAEADLNVNFTSAIREKVAELTGHKEYFYVNDWVLPFEGW